MKRMELIDNYYNKIVNRIHFIYKQIIKL